MTTSEPMLSQLAWLTASATMHARRPVRRVGATRASARSGNTKEHYILTFPGSSARRFAIRAWCARLSEAAPTSRGGSAQVPCEHAQAFAEGLPTHEPNDALLREPGPTSPLALHRPSLSHFRGVQDRRGAALQLGSRASVRQPSQHPQARWAAFFFSCPLGGDEDAHGKSTSPVASLTEYWDKSGLLCIIIKQDNDDDPIADVSAASHGDAPLTQAEAEKLTKPTHYISGGLSLDHHLLYACMLDGWRWREFGVTGPKVEAALTSMESCNHRS
ncbi:hypothetical protein EDB83DRAFT_2315374 [Lactarius deliciosus]|nr:hypothetical protein EDB83DRAFT_2315374 [Lactarius deliciosus]